MILERQKSFRVLKERKAKEAAAHPKVSLLKKFCCRRKRRKEGSRSRDAFPGMSFWRVD